jgi:radical SAM protein with 4Fe4S-binding SPASM domain
MQPRLEHYVRNPAPERARALFKSSVSTISIAISSYCNRQCSYCPNSIADRKTHDHRMDDGLFFNIVRQLSAIDYAGVVHVHRYNEPLADRAYALSRIRDIHVFVPKARIVIFTNGDYLDREYLAALAERGVAEVNVTVHGGPGGKIDIDSLMIEQDRRIADLGLTVTFTPADPAAQQREKLRTATGSHGAMTVQINAVDFYRGKEVGHTWAFDRGVLPITRRYVREKPCLAQFYQMEIEWDGTLLPCCQINNDAFPHNDYVLGKLDAQSDMFAAWTNEHYVAWRIRMSTSEQKGAPCTTCNYGLPSGPTQAEITERLAKMQAALATLKAS